VHISNVCAWAITIAGGRIRFSAAADAFGQNWPKHLFTYHELVSLANPYRSRGCVVYIRMRTFVGSSTTLPFLLSCIRTPTLLVGSKSGAPGFDRHRSGASLTQGTLKFAPSCTQTCGTYILHVVHEPHVFLSDRVVCTGPIVLEV